MLTWEVHSQGSPPLGGNTENSAQLMDTFTEQNTHKSRSGPSRKYIYDIHFTVNGNSSPLHREISILYISSWGDTLFLKIFFFFLVCAISKVFIESVTIWLLLFIFGVLASSQGDLSFLTSILPHTPALGGKDLTSGPPGQSQGGYFKLSIKGKIK